MRLPAFLASPLTRRFVAASLLGAVALPQASGLAQPRAPSPLGAEEQTARYFDSIREEPNLVLLFLRRMPKGGDLHSHLSGAVYAESYLRWAAEDSLCVDAQALALAPPPCDAAAGKRPAADALGNATLYGQLIDAWSMRNWHPARKNGHDQFFETFGKFGPATGRTGEMLAEVAARAAAGHVSYLELMLTPDGGAVARLGSRVGWEPDLGRLREKLLAAGLRDSLGAARRALDRAEARQREVLRCGTPAADPGCAVTVRYLYQVGRARPREQVFAQILAGFEMASADPRVVGFNLVQPEDHFIAMGDFSLHMEMIDFLQRLYPGVRIALHAGELVPGLVPPEGLRSHIRESVRKGHASRIGHGVDVLHEDDPIGLLQEMAERRVLVAVALTSNDVILGVRGKRHPLAMYLRYGVPVALVTDDEGVSRSEMTMEYLKAVEEHGLGYTTLKAMARNSLEHAFVEGESLWADARLFVPVPPCSADAGGLEGVRCREFIARNLKARLQWELEHAFRQFEQEYAAAERQSGTSVPARP